MGRKLAAGNWKMNGSGALIAGLDEVVAALPAAETEVLICPPFPWLSAAMSAAGDSALRIGAQDCHAAASGAHTGDVAAPMLSELGVRDVILGHSERRADHGETDADVAAKIAAAQAAKMRAILCLGESLDIREAGETADVVRTQLDGSLPDGVDPGALVIAYEPIWAIGTGAVASADQIGEVHRLLRSELVARFGAAGADIPVLYGGSVKANNAAEIFAVDNVDGALVGGASLKPADFLPIVKALADA